MRVTYFYRSLNCGISIKKVFNTVAEEVGKTLEINSHYVPAHRADLLSVLKNIIHVFKHRDTSGINHITGDIHYGMLGLIGCKSVLTIHDLSALEGAQNPIKKILTKLLWFKLPLLIADRVVCISQHTRNELMKITSRKDIEVVYNAIDPMFNYKPKPFNQDLPNILQIGTAWNKNMPNTIKAISTINCHLVVIGSLNTELEHLLKENRISYTIKANLSDQELIEEYNQCDIVSFCSLYEGFGMPIIEANAIGRCVITSNMAPMTEVASDAACLVNPNDVETINKGFVEVISDAQYREVLIENGLSNVKRFKVSEISDAYISLYSAL